MTNTTYVVDTSSFVDLARRYPEDVFPQVWKNLEALIRDDLLVAPIDVRQELERRHDQLLSWAKKNKRMFVMNSQTQSLTVLRIVNEYRLSKKRGSLDADAWIIALANERAHSLDQETVIVTEENKV